MKKIISILAGDGGNIHFVNPIAKYLETFFEVRVYNKMEYTINELQKILNDSNLVWYEWGNGPVLQASQLSRKAKTILRIHRYEILSGEIKYINWKNIDNVIFVNEEFHLLFKQLVNDAIDKQSSVNIIPNPIAHFDLIKEHTPGYNIAYISRFNADKNPQLMIQILKKLVDVDTRYKVYMAGGIQNYQLYLYCQHLVNEFNLQNNFISEGTISDIPKWLHDKNYILSTSIVEAHPVSISEAMMQGVKPVIHNSYGGLGKIFKDEYIFNTVEEAVELITSKEYNSKEYHALVTERFSDKILLPKIKGMIDVTLGISKPESLNSTAGKNPSISICMPTFNRSQLITSAVESALSQNYDNYELLIMDDGSTDNTEEIVKNISSPRIRYFKKENEGRPKTRNKLIREAAGDYILWLDDDDLLVPGVLAEYSQILKKDPGIDVIYGVLQSFDSSTGNNLQLFDPQDYSKNNKYILSNLIAGSGITSGGALIRKKLLLDIGGLNEEYLRAQDNELWSRLAAEARFYKLDKIVYKYRIHQDNISFNNFVDRSYESLTIRTTLNRYPLHKIFPDTNEQEAMFLAAKGLYNFGDYFNSSNILRGIDPFASVEKFELFFNCLLNMGNIPEAEEILKSAEIKNENLLSLMENKIKLTKDFRAVIKILKSKKDYVGIKNRIQEYVNNASYNFDAASALGFLLVELGQLKAAFDYLGQAIRFNPINDKCFDAALNITPGVKEKEQLRKMRMRLVKEIPFYSEKKGNNTETLSNEILFSVIITTFNRPDKLKAAIESVLQQTNSNFEIIVVNDAGEDVSGVVNEFNSSKIKLINSEINKGLAASRNIGIKEAKGKYITLLDDDDIYYPNHLQVISDNLRDESKVVYTDAVRKAYVKDGNKYLLESQTVPYSMDFDRNKLLIGNIAPVNCFAFEKSLVEKSGYFDENLPVLEDWEFWLRLSSFTNFRHIKENTVQVNWYNDGTTMTSSKAEAFGKTREMIYQKYKNEIDRIPNVNEIVSEFNAIWQNDSQAPVPLVSIIALTFNQLEYTKAFVDSVFRNTDLLFELILVDNNSKPDTVKYLTKLKNTNKRVKVIFNKSNLGFPKGVNQALKAAQGNYILVANNDIVVTRGWLTRMIEIADSDKKFGLIGPISNVVSGVQVDTNAAYNTIEQMHAYAAKVRRNNKGKFFQFPRVAFLCTLIKREIINKIGGLDERFSPGNFEDDDFCLRAQMAGYTTIVAQDVFIHHFGSKSFTAQGLEKYQERLDINKKIFIDKWGADPEEIWLQGKLPNIRSIEIPLDSDEAFEIVKRSQVCLQDKEYQRALEYLEKVLNDEMLIKNLPVQNLDPLFNLAGKISFMLQLYEKSLGFYTRELQYNPQSLRAFNGMGEVYTAKGEDAKAAEMFEKAGVRKMQDAAAK